MPTLAEATAPRDTSNLEPLAAPPLFSSAPPPPNTGVPKNNPRVIGDLPLVFGTTPDFQRNFYRSGTSQTRIPPLPTQASAAIGAATRSQIIVQQQSGGGQVDLQVNGVDNPDQTKLNLTGTAVAYGPGPGQVAITAGSGDGLVHGDPIWAADSTYVSYRDDFRMGNATPSAAGGTSAFGDLRWDGVTGTGAVWSKNAAYNALPHTGWVTSFSGGTASTYSSIFFPFAATSGSQYNAAMPLLDYPGWKMVWVFGFFSQRTDSTASPFPLTKKQLYIGLSPTLNAATWNPGGTVNARPPYFIGLRFDTDNTVSPAIGDSTFQFEVVGNPNFAQTRNNTQGTVSNTSITPTEFVSYRLEIIYTSSTSLTMNLDGSDGSSATHTFTSVPTISSISGVSGLAMSASRNNGLGRMTYTTNATAGTSNYCWAMGSKVTITNSTFTPVNGLHTLIGDATGAVVFVLAGGIGSASPSSATITGYPGLVPYFSWGNTPEVGPVTAAIAIDFFSFVWNSGLASPPLATVSTASRWITGS